jgi:hypothetical protein
VIHGERLMGSLVTTSEGCHESERGEKDKSPSVKDTGKEDMHNAQQSVALYQSAASAVPQASRQ